MRRWHLLCVLISFFLLLAISAMTSALVGGGVGIDLSGNDPVELRPSTKTFLANAKGRISLTYFSSSKEKMPAEMKEVEPTMRRLLARLKREAPDLIDIRFIDPDVDPKNGAAYASRKAVAPIKIRKVRYDATSEQAVWSALDIAFNDHPNVVIPFIRASDLPYMQDLIISNVTMMALPNTAMVGVSAPAEGFTEVPKVLSGIPRTTAVRIDFEKTHALPTALDLFLWIAPRQVDDTHLRELERFVDSGRSVIIAGSEYNILCRTDAGSASCRVERPPYEFRNLTRAFGLGVRDEIVVDNPIRVPGATVPFPIHFPASLTDIRALHGFTVGELHVSSVTALEPDPDLLNQSGFEAQVVATTSADTRIIPEARDLFGQDALRRAIPVPKQPWVVRLNPTDSWRGSLLFMGTPSVLSDQFLKESDNANNLLLKAAVETFTSPDTLARLRIARQLPQAIPELGDARRLMVRAVVVGLLPILLMVFGMTRGRARLSLPRGVSWNIPATEAVLVLALILVINAFFETRPLTPFSVSSSSPTATSPAVAELLSRAKEPIKADIIISAERDWPATQKQSERIIRTALRGLGIPYQIVDPEKLSREERDALIDAGIEPFTIDRVEGDQTVRSRVWAAIRLRTPSLSTVIPRLDPRTLTDLQFLIGAAIQRLDRQSAGPLVGFVTDIPRMTGAQAFEEYTQMGYTPPEGSNPFGEVENLLRRYGYQVRVLNPNAPDFGGKLDLVVWLQPRAPEKLLPQFGDYLARGGQAFVALQQYKVKQRQYRGRGYDTVYWPEPQTHRFNEYTKSIGISQMGEKAGGPAEILLDKNQGRLALDTRVYQRSRYREMLKQEVVRPFLIRAVGRGLSASSPITARLGALLYIWGGRFALDQARIAELGLRVITLAQTSPQPWKFIWDGGWIPEPALSAPSAEQQMEGPVPLAIAVTGRFPTSADSTPSTIDARRDGTLILSGSSEMFTDANLYAPGYQHDRFLLNSVASLAYGPELGNLQARPSYAQGFPAPSRAGTVLLRCIVVFAAPATLLLFGVWQIARRRSTRST